MTETRSSQRTMAGQLEKAMNDPPIKCSQLKSDYIGSSGAGIVLAA